MARVTPSGMDRAGASPTRRRTRITAAWRTLEGTGGLRLRESTIRRRAVWDRRNTVYRIANSQTAPSLELPESAFAHPLQIGDSGATCTSRILQEFLKGRPDTLEVYRATKGAPAKNGTSEGLKRPIREVAWRRVGRPTLLSITLANTAPLIFVSVRFAHSARPTHTRPFPLPNRPFTGTSAIPLQFVMERECISSSAGREPTRGRRNLGFYGLTPRSAAFRPLAKNGIAFAPMRFLKLLCPATRTPTAHSSSRFANGPEGPLGQ